MKISNKKLKILIETFLKEDDEFGKNVSAAFEKTFQKYSPGNNYNGEYGSEDYEVFIEPKGIIFKYPDGEEEILELGQFDDEISSYELIKEFMSDNGIDDIDGDLDEDAFEHLMIIFDTSADQLMTQDSFEKFGSNEEITQIMKDFAANNYGNFYDEDNRFVIRAKKLEKLKKLNLPPNQQKPYFQIGENKYYLDSYRIKHFKTSEADEINRGFKKARINVVGIRDSSGFLFSLEENGQLTKRGDVYVTAFQDKNPPAGVYIHYKGSGRRFYKQGEDFLGIGKIKKVGIDKK